MYRLVLALFVLAVSSPAQTSAAYKAAVRYHQGDAIVDPQTGAVFVAVPASPLNRGIAEVRRLDGEWRSDLALADSVYDRAIVEIERNQGSAQDRADAVAERLASQNTIAVDIHEKWVREVKPKVTEDFEADIARRKLSADQEKTERDTFALTIKQADDSASLDRNKYAALIQYLKKLRDSR